MNWEEQAKQNCYTNWKSSEETIKAVERNYGVSEVTDEDWKRNRSKIEQWCTKYYSKRFNEQSRITTGNVN